MAEQLINEFTVNRPIEEAWPLITDVERIAPCLPGAELQEVEGETYRGVVKVKLGAISSQFKGEAHFIERDDDELPRRDQGHRSRHRRPGQRIGGDHRPGREPVADQHPGGGHHRPPHHRQGRPVRSGHHGRRQLEADGPVRRQPQPDDRRGGPARRPRRLPNATAEAPSTDATPADATHVRRRIGADRRSARSRVRPPSRST